MKKHRSLCLLLALMMLLAACGAPAAPAETAIPSPLPAVTAVAPETGYADGIYEGAAAGMGGELTVSVTIEGGGIAAVEVLSHSETPGISDPAIAEIPVSILKNGSPDVDTVSGCTVTSKAIKEAVAVALSKADGTYVEPAGESAVPGQADVVVIGLGFAGMNAAIEAANQGADVLVLEKNDSRGGSLRLAGGTLSGACTRMQAEAGIEDSPELFYEEIVSRNEGIGGEANYTPDVAMYYCQHSGEAVDWLDSLGCDMGERTVGQPTLYQPMKVARVYSTGSSASYLEKVGELLDAQVEEGSVTVCYQTKVTGLVQQADGSITGVRAVDENGTQHTVEAGAVILCTGGYGHSEELLKEFNFQNVLTTAPAANTGDGHIFARDAGAVLKNMDYCSTYAGGLYTSTSGFVRTRYIRIKDFPYMIFVNAQGSRFVDELGNEDGTDYDEIVSWWKKGDNTVFIVFDQAMVDELKAMEKPIIQGDADWSKFEAALEEAESVFRGETLEEAAQRAGVDAAGLAATIERYNGFVKSGTDEDFGRTRLMKEFTDGPYYILKTIPYVMITSGGPVMNDKCQVLDGTGEPIPGLYQAGEIAGNACVIGHTTLGGVSNTGCVVFGKRAGACAAEYAKK